MVLAGLEVLSSEIHNRIFEVASSSFDCNEGKRHGLNFDIVERIPKETTLLVIPDSSSSDVTFHEELYNAGLDLLILDHHEFDIITSSCTRTDSRLSRCKELRNTRIMFTRFRKIYRE